MKRWAFVPLLLLAACSKEPQQEATPALSDAPGGPASEAALATAPDERPDRASHYTSFKDCKLVKANEDEDWSTSHCAGLGGYDLELAYADARDDLVLMPQGQRPTKFELYSLGGGGFNTLADTAEWRGEARQGTFRPTALIVRNQVSEDPSNSARQTSILVVIDLQQGCVIGQARPGKGQNEAARAIADGPARPCLKY